MKGGFLPIDGFSELFCRLVGGGALGGVGVGFALALAVVVIRKGGVFGLLLLFDWGGGFGDGLPCEVGGELLSGCAQAGDGRCFLLRYLTELFVSFGQGADCGLEVTDRSKDHSD